MPNTKEILALTQPLSLLYVEDDPQLRESMIELLGSFFNELDIAEDGQIALNSYRAKQKESIAYKNNLEALVEERTKQLQASLSHDSIIHLPNRYAQEKAL